MVGDELFHLLPALALSVFRFVGTATIATCTESPTATADENNDDDNDNNDDDDDNEDNCP